MSAQTSGASGKRARIEIIDALRGLAVTLMVIHHFLYDLTAFLSLPRVFFSNPVFDFLHYVFAGVFIALAGASSRFSRSNFKRAFVTLGAAALVSAVSAAVDMPIYFGVLHLLGVCMLVYAVFERLLEKINAAVLAVLSVLLTVLGAYAVTAFSFDSWALYPVGLSAKEIESFDYFPLLPWIFVFLFGSGVGKYIKDNRFPPRFYTVKIPVLPAIGRHSLIIYLAHQPVLFALTALLSLIFK